MNPECKELLDAAESVLGLVWGERYIEGPRELEDLPPLVPQTVRAIAAGQVFMRLIRAVDAVRAKRNQQRLEPITE